MRTLNDQLALIKKQKKLGIMTHAVIGFPSLEDTFFICKEMEKAGVDIIELQIPFSDPLADGPIIMDANGKTLQQGIIIKDCFSTMKKITTNLKIPVVCMTYYQVAFAYGFSNFCQKLQEIGIQGMIIPDIPIDEEEYDHVISISNSFKLPLIRVISPTSSSERLRMNLAVSNSFIYCTSRNGTTGTHGLLDPKIVDFLKKIRSHGQIMIAVGFGIRNKSDLALLKNQADIAVIGSSVIEQINTHGIESVKAFLSNLCQTNKVKAIKGIL